MWYGLLIGIIIGLVGGVLIDRDTVNKILVRKIKQKRTSGQNEVSIPIDVQNAVKRAKKTKLDRLRDRLERKKLKELNRLNKGNQIR